MRFNRVKYSCAPVTKHLYDFKLYLAFHVNLFSLIQKRQLFLIVSITSDLTFRSINVKRIHSRNIQIILLHKKNAAPIIFFSLSNLILIFMHLLERIISSFIINQFQRIVNFHSFRNTLKLESFQTSTSTQSTYDPGLATRSADPS